MPQRKYITIHPTQHWQTKKARTDLINRMEQIAKLLHIPIVQLFNEILEDGLNRLDKLTVEGLLQERNTKEPDI